MRSRHLAVIATLVSALACGGDQSSDESLLVDVDLSENQATVARAYPVGERLLPRGHREQLLRYELRSGDELITHGVISDPRWARYEVINPDGSMSDELEYIGRGRVTLRLPRRTGELVFFAENQQGNDLVEVSRALFDPSTQEVDDEVVRTGFAATRGRTVQALRPDDENPVPSFCRVSDGNTRCVDLIAGSGSEVLNLDIAFVPAGFSGADDPGFRATARRVAQQMLAEEDFGKYQSRVNFWVYTGAGDTNPIPDLRDDPEAEDEDFYRRDNGYPRWNSSFRERMQGLVDFLNPELVVVLAANDRCTEDGDCRERCLTSAEIGNDGDRICYNWGGVANSGLGFTVGNEGDPNLAQMLIHEVGHAYFELGDEYGVRGTKNCTDDDAISRAERYKNLTLNTDEVDDGSDEATEVHWSSQITIDEPEADFDTYMSYGYDFSAMEGEVSTFIGGGTCRRKLKRGQLQCRMHSHPDYTWCEVCDRLVEEKFDEWQESAGEVCPSRWRDDGICDRCLGDDPDCCGIFELRCRARRVTCGDGTCNPLFGETLDTCLDDCAPNECGDGVCEGTEDDETCADDCGCASVDRSSDITPLGCFCGPDCTDFGDCCADSCQEFGNGC